MLERHIQEIESALQSRLLYIALSQCLALPDICGALEASDGEATGARYIAWFDRYLAKKYWVGASFAGYQALTGKDCWYLRCSILHQASTMHNKGMFDRILFTFENEKMHVNVGGQALPKELEAHIFGKGPRPSTVAGTYLQLHVQTFCSDIIKGVREWAKDHERDQVVIRNLERTMEFHPRGLKGFIEDVPLFG